MFTEFREVTYDEFVCDFGSDEPEDEVEHDWKIKVEIAFGGGVVTGQSYHQEWNNWSQDTRTLKIIIITSFPKSRTRFKCYKFNKTEINTLWNKVTFAN